MHPATVIAKLCNIPRDFRGGSKSAFQLFSESGVAALASLPSAAEVAAYLGSHPELVQDWLDWSGDKRVLSGWYFLEEQGEFVVGFHPDGEVFRFERADVACAHFIVREVQDVSGRGLR